MEIKDLGLDICDGHFHVTPLLYAVEFHIGLHLWPERQEMLEQDIEFSCLIISVSKVQLCNPLCLQ